MGNRPQEEHGMQELTKIIAAGVGTVALAGGIGAGLAYADTPSDEPTTTPTASNVIRTATAAASFEGACWLARCMVRSLSRVRSTE